MRTLEDIKDLVHGPYGVQATLNTFKSHATNGFYKAEREWKGVLETCDELIWKKHKLTPGTPVIGLTDMPVVFAFRKAYQQVLQKMPEGIDTCRQQLDDMLTTLETVRSLDDITPYETDADMTDFLVTRLKCGEIEEKHIHTLPDLAKKTAAKWTKRRAAKKKHQVDAWDERTYEQTLLGRPDIVGGRLYPNGTNKTVGHFILREDDGVRGKELIDWAADDAVGVSDVLASFLVLQLQQTTEKRIVNLVEQFH